MAARSKGGKPAADEQVELDSANEAADQAGDTSVEQADEPKYEGFDLGLLVGKQVMLQLAQPAVLPAINQAGVVGPRAANVRQEQGGMQAQAAISPVVSGRLKNYGSEAKPLYVLEMFDQGAYKYLYVHIRPQTVLLASWAGDVSVAPGPGMPPGSSGQMPGQPPMPPVAGAGGFSPGPRY